MNLFGIRKHFQVTKRKIYFQKKKKQKIKLLEKQILGVIPPKQILTGYGFLRKLSM